jgi:hypothetical protein
MTVTCCAVVLGDAKANARNVNVPEICMAVTVPDGRRVCLSLSPTWGYIHGVEFDTDPSRDCAKNKPAIGERMMGIWQNANPGDDTARSYIKSECEGAKIRWVKDRHAGLADMPSGFCVVSRYKHVLRANMVGYAGTSYLRADHPAVFYTAWMVSPRAHFRRDFRAFLAFTSSARITDHRCLARLSE